MKETKLGTFLVRPLATCECNKITHGIRLLVMSLLCMVGVFLPASEQVRFNFANGGFQLVKFQ